MKKILAIFVLCFAVFAANAQIFLLQESFDESTMPAGWTAIDADGDGFNWVPSLTAGNFIANTGDGCVVSASYDNDNSVALTPDNWLISPAVAIPTSAQDVTLSWWVRGQDPSFATENYAVYVSTTGTTVADFADPFLYEGVATGDYVNLTLDLTSYVGQTIYIAFRHYNVTDMFFLNLDDIEVTYVNPNIANAPSNFTATPDPDYALSVDLSWTNPTTTVGNEALTAINSIELYRNGTLLNSFSNPAVGGNMTYTDNTMTASGIYSYLIYAVTGNGNGQEATLEGVMVGHLCPITIDMVDSYGDGWNGAAIEIYDANNILVGSYTVENGTESVQDVQLPVGTYTLVWVSGSYDSECSFSITDAYGIPLYTSEGTMAAGTFFTLNQTCEAPAMYTVSGVVTAAADNSPIANATVTVSGMNGNVLTTDASGAYSISDIVSILPYSMTVEADGFNGAATSFNGLSADTTINFSLTAPQFDVTYAGPIEVTTTYGLDAQFAPITVTNNGNGTLTWGTNVEFVRGTRNTNEPMHYAVAQMPRVKTGAATACRRVEGATAQTMLASVDYCPMTASISGNPTRDAWDLLSSFDASEAGQQGIATDGNYIYTCYWNAAGQFGKYDLDGNFIETFTIAGVGGIRDLTYDGTYFYGGAGGADLYQIDMASQTLVATISTSVSTIRHCSYDPQNDGFWVGNWSDLFLVDRNGSVVTTGPSDLSSAYGSAYDGYSDGGPFLWLFTQVDGNTGSCVFAQYDIAANAMTNVTFDLSTVDQAITSGATAGGAFGTDALVSGKFVIMANSQQDPNHVSVIEIANAGWLSAAPGSGTVAAGQSTDITLNFNGSYPVGDYNANLTISSRNPYVGATVIPVVYHIIAPDCDAPTNLQVVPTDYEYMALTWDAPADVTNLVEYRIYRGSSSNYVTSTTTSYNDYVNAGNYCYSVRAYYEDGDEVCLSLPTDTVCAELLLCDPNNMCDIRVDMFDDYGDGWNGASIQLLFDGQMISTFTCDGDQGSLTVPVCSGSLSFVWVAGSYDSECMFTIYNANNVVLYDGQSAPSAGEFFTYNLNCQDLEDDINEMEINKNVSIYPNPATTVLNVVAEGYNTIEVINLLGQTVYTCNATNNTQINVSNLRNGVYFVRVNGEKGTTTQKFIKK